MYPKLIVDTKKYKHNVEKLLKLCHNFDISMMAVTKVFCADSRLIDILEECKVDYIADSRLLNLKNMKTSLPKVMLRLVSMHEVDEVVQHVDISLNSELMVIKAINDAAKKLNKIHKVILMIDIGDLREGIFYKENIIESVSAIESFTHVELLGLGTNLTCYGGIIPTEDTLKRLIDITHFVENYLDRKLELISGGNSSHLHLLFKNKKIDKINNLRLGESLILGRETAFGDSISTLYQDVITLEVDLIEIKYKPSIPEGDIGMDAFGKKPSFKDYGLMKRGILAIGKQDVDFHELIPVNESIRLIGSSSDHIIVDLTNSKIDYQVGDIIKFKLSYGSLLSLMTSRYVGRVYI